MRTVGFEHLHLHTHSSLLDGIGFTHEYVKRIPKINQRFLCITDHGMMAAVPEQIQLCEKNGISPVFGCELYLNPLQPNEKKETSEYTEGMTQEEKDLFKKSYHLIALASTQTGYKNLVRLSSWAWLNGFYRKPRVNYDQLMQHKEGIIFSSACFNSEIGQATLRSEAEGLAMVQRYKEMFAPNFYLEMMLLDFDKQRAYNQFLIKAAEIFNLPLTITCDVHYCNKEDSLLQQLFLMVQTQKTIAEVAEAAKQNPDLFELQDTNLWLKSEEELNEKWEKEYQDIPLEIFEEAKRNTVRICEQCKGVTLDRSPKLPQIPDADNKLIEAVREGIKRRHYKVTPEVKDRIKEEFTLIKEKGFSSYLLLQKMMTDEAKRKCPELLGWGDGSEATGPGRGSAAGSLLLYLIGVTNVDPIKFDLLFSRFLSPARGGKQMKLRFSQ